MYDEKNRGEWVFIPLVYPLNFEGQLVSVRVGGAAVRGVISGSNFPTSGPPTQQPEGTLETCGDCGFRWDPRTGDQAISSCPPCWAANKAGEIGELRKELRKRDFDIEAWEAAHALLEQRANRYQQDLKNLVREVGGGQPSATSQAKPATPRGAQVQVDHDWDLLPDA